MSRSSCSLLRVHLAHPPPGDALRTLEDGLDPGVRLTLGPADPAPETEILISGRPSQEQLKACRRLRALIIPYAGLPAPTRDLLLAELPTLEVHNLHHNAAAAAELAVSLMLAAAKTLLPVDRQFRQHNWRSHYEGALTTLLDGKLALILGLGAIGTRLAAVCRALGMDVHAIRKHANLPGPQGVTVHPVSAIDAVLPQADVLLICLPLTLDTEGLLGEHQLGLLRPSSVLVNVARGAIVDEEALYRALSGRRIAAAGIDVWYRYPSTSEERENTPPSRFPFHELDNIVMSPHRGGAYRAEELEAQRMSDLVTTLNALARGMTVPHRVDVRAGY